MRLDFSIRRVVVHPVHGPAEVVGLGSRSVNGFEVDYVDLLVLGGGLQVSLPVASAESLGLRNVVSSDEVRSIFEVLRADSSCEELVWSRRYKGNQERMVSKSPYVLAGLVRDIHRRRVSLGVSPAERRQLETALDVLASEVCIAQGHSQSDVAARMILDAVVEYGHSPRLVRAI